MRRFLILPVAAALLAAAAGIGSAQGQQPKVAGDWTGTWTVQDPVKPGEEPKKAYPGLRLDCKVADPKVDKWEATFEGECGRPYKYTVKMLGRQAGDAVLFQGSADLGEKDGGVYDWIGRANEKEFVGFFTSQKHVGTFRLTRPSAGLPELRRRGGCHRSRLYVYTPGGSIPCQLTGAEGAALR